MFKREDVIEWIDEEDEMQCSWFVKHLKRKKMFVDSSKTYNSNYEKCTYLVEHLIDNQGNSNFFDLLKRSWSSYKNKNKDGNKSFSFVMSENTDIELDKLARKQGFTRNRALELIISKQYSKEIRAKAQREKLKKTEQEQFRHGLKRAAIYAEHDQLKKDHIKTIDELKSLKLIADKQRSKIFEYEIKLEAIGFGLIEEVLSDEQKSQLADMIQKANEYHEQASKNPTELIEISEDHKTKLNQIAISNNMKLSDLLDSLIEIGS